MRSELFDVAVVGTGTAAYTAIAELASHGHKLAVIDERPYGGTCALRGCQAKKFFTHAAATIDSARRLEGRGLNGTPKLDFRAIREQKNAFTGPIPESTRRAFERFGAATFKGRATFVGRHRLEVAGERVDARKFIIATGSSPRGLEIPGFELCGTSDDFLEADSLPAEVLFLGGGYISFEFAHVAARAGSQVTLLHRSARVLKGFEDDLVDVLVRASRDEAGIDVRLSAEVARIEKSHEKLRVHLASGERLEAGAVYAAVGRVPNTAGLDLEAAGVSFGKGGILVNKHLQSLTHPDVYAVGDVVAGKPMLATTADHEGKIAALNIACGNCKQIDYGALPSAVFTTPQLASVGLTEEQARERGLAFRVNQGSTRDWPSSKRTGETVSGYKVLIEAGSGRILGAHVVRDEAAELINLFALAMQQGVTAQRLRDTLWAYPSYTSDIKYLVA